MGNLVEQYHVVFSIWKASFIAALLNKLKSLWKSIVFSKFLRFYLKIMVIDRTLKGLVSMVFSSHGVLIFLVLSMFFHCFYEHSGDLYNESDLTHCFDFGVVGIYLKCCYLGKAKQCELITQITFYNNNFGELSQIYRTIHFHMIKLLSWILRSDILNLFG